MTQAPVTRCQYCGSQDIGEGWQHGEDPLTFKLSWIAGKAAEVPDLPQLCGSAISMCGRTSPLPQSEITLGVGDG